MEESTLDIKNRQTFNIQKDLSANKSRFFAHHIGAKIVPQFHCSIIKSLLSLIITELLRFLTLWELIPQFWG